MEYLDVLKMMRKKFGSFCTCGHIGDKENSDHQDTAVFRAAWSGSIPSGHGSCKKCECSQFSWKNFNFSIE